MSRKELLRTLEISQKSNDFLIFLTVFNFFLNLIIYIKTNHIIFLLSSFASMYILYKLYVLRLRAETVKKYVELFEEPADLQEIRLP